ncbi:hypothetical protein [uncultured Microbulbifer sp.]|uniref:hypothetical protein n=1 Tax=uncultured Microbulbifer sp. TaxID=348147 RepID=UPI002634A8AE|nr:hypothetical protein [uncultured Microbulbifer sp.]
MKCKGLFVTILGLGLLAGCASEPSYNQKENTTGNESVQVSQSNLAENTSNQLICKSRAITGSRFKQKTCMTAEEWKRMSRESSNMVNNQNRKGVLGNPDGG